MFANQGCGNFNGGLIDGQNDQIRPVKMKEPPRFVRIFGADVAAAPRAEDCSCDFSEGNNA